MFSVLARFPFTPAAKEAVLASLDESSDLLRTWPGAVAQQTWIPDDDENCRVVHMLWADKEAFTAFVASEESKKAHAGISQDAWRETPSLEYGTVTSTMHATSATAA